MAKRIELEPSEAITTLKKLKKWRKGEIDEWDETNRVPPPKIVNAVIDASLDALYVLDRLHLHKKDLTHSYGVLNVAEPGKRTIEILHSKKAKFEHLKF